MTTRDDDDKLKKEKEGDTGAVTSTLGNEVPAEDVNAAGVLGEEETLDTPEKRRDQGLIGVNKRFRLDDSVYDEGTLLGEKIIARDGVLRQYEEELKKWEEFKKQWEGFGLMVEMQLKWDRLMKMFDSEFGNAQPRGELEAEFKALISQRKEMVKLGEELISIESLKPAMNRLRDHMGSFMGVHENHVDLDYAPRQLMKYLEEIGIKIQHWWDSNDNDRYFAKETDSESLRKILDGDIAGKRRPVDEAGKRLNSEIIKLYEKYKDNPVIKDIAERDDKKT